MGQEGSRGGMDHRNAHVEEDNHQWAHELLGVNGNGRGHRHSSHGEVGFCRGILRGEGCIHGGHGVHSHPGKACELGSEIEPDRGECPAESMKH